MIDLNQRNAVVNKNDEKSDGADSIESPNPPPGFGRDFYKHGITMITVVNREYCKKLIVVLPGQKHPEQFHEKKEETFVILYGEIELTLDDETISCGIGDIITIRPGMKHAFKSEKGAVIEEISSTHYVDDSFYTDSSIMQNKQRKTCLSYWME